MFDLPWLLAGAIMTLSATLQAISGFGFAMTSTPLLLMVYDARTAIILNMIIATFTQAILTSRCHEDIHRPTLKNLLLGSVLGIPLGVYCFINFSTRSLKILVGAAVLILSLAVMARDTLKRKRAGTADAVELPQGFNRGETALQRVLGVLAGFLCGSVSVCGPVIGLYLALRAAPKARFRAIMSCYLLLAGLVSLGLYLTFSAIRLEDFLLSISLIPFALAGNALGWRLFPRVSQRAFQRGVPVLVLAVALYTILNALARR